MKKRLFYQTNRILDNAILNVTDERSPNKKYPYWFYTIQCKHGGCIWWIKGRRLRKLEDEFVLHSIDWHDT